MVERGALSIKEFVAWSGASRSRTYREIAAGRLRAAKMGRRTVILTSEAKRWLESLPVMDGGDHAQAA
jgi:excisionase family DNA binding protein